MERCRAPRHPAKAATDHASLRPGYTVVTASIVVRSVELVEPQHRRRGLLADPGRGVIGKLDSRGFERALQFLRGRPRHGFFRLEIAHDGKLDAGSGCEAIFTPIEKSAGGAALGGGHDR